MPVKNMYRKLAIESRIKNLRIIENAIDEMTSEIGITYNNYGKILISTMEAVNNAILHGNESQPEKKVEVEIAFIDEQLTIKVSDEGDGFSPAEIPDPTNPERIAEVNGRGVYIMTKLADEIQYNEKGNVVTMIFRNICT
jgi:serine/threonine-protein kinase RsbW